jgi:hypothetical protein
MFRSDFQELYARVEGRSDGKKNVLHQIDWGAHLTLFGLFATGNSLVSKIGILSLYANMSKGLPVLCRWLY